MIFYEDETKRKSNEAKRSFPVLKEVFKAKEKNRVDLMTTWPPERPLAT